MSTLIFIMRIRFLFYNNFRKRGYKVFVVKRYMSGDAKTVGNNIKLIDIVKMTINV